METEEEHGDDEDSAYEIGLGCRLIAFRLDPDCKFRLVPAGVERDWIRRTSKRFAGHCVPMLMANQAGWFMLNDAEVRLTWDGGPDRSALRIERADGDDRLQPISHFGHGIVTWESPFLFRTSPGWNLLVRGPANYPKDGAHALEGLVETDWAVATFTINWVLTRPTKPVTFHAGEPVCMLVPQRRRELETIEPEERPIESDPALAHHYDEWLVARQRTLIDGTRLSSPRRWEGDYVRGTSPSGASASDHQVKQRLRRFSRPA